jgi:hypothetical protein
MQWIYLQQYAGSLNVCLLISVLKSKVGINDVVQVLSCLNIKSPDRRGLQRRFNRLSDMMVDVNKQRMIDNQTYVKHILQLAGEENLVDVETDSSYNNRPQPGCEAATQTFCPLVEQCTTKKLTINIETANVNCPSKNCEHNVDTCKRNYKAVVCCCRKSLFLHQQDFLPRPIEECASHMFDCQSSFVC